MTSRHWTEISINPNLPEVLRFRSSQLNEARGRPVPERIEFFSDAARNRRVLDVGVVNHMAETSQDPAWLHGRLVEVAAYCRGVDILEDETRKLREKGYNVTQCDITSDPEAVDELFDVVVCGELIEHLGNPGGLFSAAVRLLAPGGNFSSRRQTHTTWDEFCGISSMLNAKASIT